MAEIDFFATDREKSGFLQPLFDRGFRFVPDLHFEAPAGTDVRKMDELLRYAQRTSQFFIIKDELLSSPLEYRRVEREGRAFYYIFPRSGGPSLVFFWGKHSVTHGIEVFGASTLSYYPWYEDSVTRERLTPSRELVREYNDVASRIQQVSRRVKPGVRAYWVTSAVESLIRKGAVLIGLEAFGPDQILGGGEKGEGEKGTA